MSIIVFGANSQATKDQCESAYLIGATIVKGGYTCIHGGGCGTMLHTSLGMQNYDLDKANHLTHVIWPRSMKVESENILEIYKNARNKEFVPTIHDRVGRLIEESKKSKYIICYGGGLGTVLEIYSILIAYYDKVDNMCEILICSTDANLFIKNILNMLNDFNIPTRPYMQKLMDKIQILTTDEIIEKLL